ncbi:15020_t:CDS:2, partial [Gigaspora rosea]
PDASAWSGFGFGNLGQHRSRDLKQPAFLDGTYGSFQIGIFRSTSSCLDRRYRWVKFSKTFTAWSFEWKPS